ncbi:MAG: HlyD family efflux transporter periplasmic adaptor subunit [Candidatus Sumerlaeia bacterium]
MIRKHPILLTILLLIVLGIGWSVWKSKQPKPIPIRVAKVARVDKLTQLAMASGEIRAHDMVDIQAEVTGIITELLVKEGQKVKKGEKLLQIDPFQYEMALASQKGRVAMAEADVKSVASDIDNRQADLARLMELLKSAESDLAQARITAERDKNSFNRYEALYKNRVISLDEFETFDTKLRISNKRVDTANSLIEQTKAQIRSAELGVEKARIQKRSSENSLAVSQAALKQSEDQFSKTTIRAPMDGVIVKLNVDVGERAVPGNQFDTKATLMIIANLSRIEAELKVDETDIVKMELGQPVEIIADALQTNDLEKVKLAAKVTEIAAAPIETQSSSSSSYSSGSSQEGRDFKVVATIDNPPADLRIGMQCDAKITKASVKNVLAVPIGAITWRDVPIDKNGRYAAPPKPDPKAKPGANGIGTMAVAATDDKTSGTKKTNKKELQGTFVKGSDGFAHFRTIKTGLMDDTNAEVLDGLKEGEEVITGPHQSLLKLDEWTLVEVEKTPGGPQGSGK